jgi:hypothetical protein
MRVLLGRARSVLALLAVVVIGAACGSSGGSNENTSSCKVEDNGNISGTDACTDYPGWPVSTVMGYCSTPGAQFATSACLRTNSIGGCSGTFNGLAYTRWYFPRAGASVAATSADVMADCASLTPAETFTPP